METLGRMGASPMGGADGLDRSGDRALGKETSSINPPHKYRDAEWHWARHDGDDKWFVFQARDGRLWNGPGHMSAEAAYQYGWRYAGPAMPLGPVTKPKTGIPMADMSDEEWEEFIRRRGPQGSQPRPV